MDKPLSDWLIPWLGRPGWQLLAAQWLVLTGVGLLAYSGLILGEWQQWERLEEQRQQLELQIAERQQQLSKLPPLTELEQSLEQQALLVSDEQGDLGAQLYQLGGRLLRFQQQEKPAQQKIRLLLDYGGLLRLLEGLPSARKIGQMKIERQSEGLITQLTLVSSAEAVDE
jgi:pilus assembly protein HofO